MKSKLSTLATAVAFALFAGQASADVVGLGVSEGTTCYAGVCPPTSPMVPGTSSAIPFNFNVTLGNGDLYNFAGIIAGSNTDGNAITKNGSFTVQFLGGPGGVSQNDTLTLDMFFAYNLNVQSGTLAATEGLTGSFSSGIASGSSAQFADFAFGPSNIIQP